MPRIPVRPPKPPPPAVKTAVATVASSAASASATGAGETDKGAVAAAAAAPREQDLLIAADADVDVDADVDADEGFERVTAQQIWIHPPDNAAPKEAESTLEAEKAAARRARQERAERHKLEPKRRLRQVAFVLMVLSSVCVLLLLATQRFNPSTTIINDNQLSTFQSSLPSFEQLWARNEVERQNRSEDLEDIISEQRRQLEEELEDYPYPNGRYNVSARSLNDLVLERGGQPLRSIIITSWRSGSTFLGDVLFSHPAIYYHYEPLLHYGIVQVLGEPLGDSAITTIRQLLLCNYTGLDSYLDYGRGHEWLWNHNSRLWYWCRASPRLCGTPEFLNPFCQLFPFQSMKVVRLRLRLVEELLLDPSLNIRVVLLVRDPRGTMQSRKHREFCPRHPDCYDPARLCSDLVSDYNAAVRFASRFPGRFKVLRYEDFSLEPYKGARDMFSFFGLDFHPTVEHFLDTHTKTDAGGVSSTYRNSKSAPFHWRQDYTHTEVRAIQKVCLPAMKIWGYVPAVNASHQIVFNPISPLQFP